MKKMTEEEIRALMEECTWGTLIAVEGDKPYGVELAFASDGEYIYCGSKPGGRMARCIKKNPNVAFKFCTTDKSTRNFKAVIVEGQAERLTKKEDILAGMRRIAKKVGMQENQLDPVAESLASHPEKSNFIRIPLKVVEGRHSG